MQVFVVAGYFNVMTSKVLLLIAFRENVSYFLDVVEPVEAPDSWQCILSGSRAGPASLNTQINLYTPFSKPMIDKLLKLLPCKVYTALNITTFLIMAEPVYSISSYMVLQVSLLILPSAAGLTDCSSQRNMSNQKFYF